MSLYEWYSVNEMVRGDSTYFVVQYDRRLRKSVALVRRTAGKGQEVVAYFRSEEKAIRFCDDVLGGRVQG